MSKIQDIKICKMSYKLMFWYTLFTSIVASATAPGKWHLINPRLTGSSLNDVTFISANEGWAVGDNGVVVHTVDSGNSWAIQPTPVEYPPPLKSVAFISKDTGYAVGGVFGRTYAIKTNNGGSTWLNVSSEFPAGGLQKINLNKGDIWVIRWSRAPNISLLGIDEKIWKDYTIGDGSSLSDIHFINDTIGNICGDNGFIGMTNNGGQTWAKKSDTLHAVFEKFSFTEANTGFCIGHLGQIAKATKIDDQKWIFCFKPQFAGRLQLNTINFLSNDSGFVLGSFSPTVRIYTKDQGSTWDVSATQIDPQVTDVSYLGNDHSIGVCWNGAIYHLFGLADSCKEITKNTGNDIELIDFYDTLHGLGGGIDGSLFLTKDGGSTWNKSIIPDSSRIRNIVAFSGGRTLLCTSNNTFLSIDYGDHWTTLLNPEFSSIIFKKQPYSLDAYSTVGNKLTYSCDAGVSWQIRGEIVFSNQKPNDQIWRLYFINKVTGWALSSYGAISTTTDMGATWHSIANIPTDIIAQDIFFVDSMKGFVCGYWGETYSPLMFFTSDGGATWSKQSNINFSQNLALPTDVSFQTRILKIKGNTLSSLWALSDNGVLFSADTGKSWQQQTVPQYGKIFYDMFLAPNEDLFVVGDNSRIWKYSSLENVRVIRAIHSATRHITRVDNNKVIMYDLKGRKQNVSLLQNHRIIGVTTKGVNNKIIANNGNVLFFK